MDFEVGEIANVETIGSCDARTRAPAKGYGRWEKRKGIARIRLPDGTICKAEAHWYEACGVGEKEFKLKRILDA